MPHNYIGFSIYLTYVCPWTLVGCLINYSIILFNDKWLYSLFITYQSKPYSINFYVDKPHIQIYKDG